MGKPHARATNARLHLVKDEKCAVRIACGTRRSKVSARGRDHTTFTLDRFKEHRRRVIRHCRRQRIRVAKGHSNDVARKGAKGILLGRLCGQGERPHGAAVEGALRDNDPVSPGASRQLDCGLVCLSARIAEEHSASPSAPGIQQSEETFRQVHRGGADRQIARVPEHGSLGRDRPHNRRVCMSQGIDGDAGEEVHVVATVRIPYACTLTADQRHRGGAVGIHDRPAPTLLPASGGRIDPRRGGHATTTVPAPVSVKASERRACSTRPSMTWARGTPPSTARRHAPILGIIPDCRPGRSPRNSCALIRAMTSELAGQSA